MSDLAPEKRVSHVRNDTRIDSCAAYLRLAKCE